MRGRESLVQEPAQRAQAGEGLAWSRKRSTARVGVPHKLGGMVGGGLQEQQELFQLGLVATVRNLAFI